METCDGNMSILVRIQIGIPALARLVLVAALAHVLEVQQRAARVLAEVREVVRQAPGHGIGIDVEALGGVLLALGDPGAAQERRAAEVLAQMQRASPAQPAEETGEERGVLVGGLDRCETNSPPGSSTSRSRANTPWISSTR